MTGGELLTAGKALLFFVLPLGLAIWELARLKRRRTDARTRPNGPTDEHERTP